jgi:glycerol-3-phosphate dehydrogenase subunit C
MEEKTLKVRLLRSDPARSEEPHYATYSIPFREKMSLVQILENIYLHTDPTLTFSYSCKRGKCGSCTVKLNGTAVLACRHVIENADKELVVEPITNFPVCKDLLVDESSFDKKVQTVLRQVKTFESTTYEILDETLIPYQDLTRCISCLACDSACTVLKAAPALYSGPGMIAAVAGPGPRLTLNGKRGVAIESSIDYCSFCLNCVIVCPANVTFPQLLSAAKHAWFGQKGWSIHDQAVGRFGSLARFLSKIPDIYRSKVTRTLLEWTLGVDRRMDLPSFNGYFDSWIRGRKSPRSGDQKVAYFVGCFARYIDSDVARDTVEVLEHNGVSVTVPDQQCCGIPLLSKGNLDETRKLAAQNVKSLRSLVMDGYDVVASCTSCSWMLKKGYSDVLGLEGAKQLAAHTFDLGEYLFRMVESGKFNAEVQPVNLTVAYHAPCHLRSQEIGKPFLEVLKVIPNLAVRDVTKQCCGLSGTYGLRKGKYDVGMEVGDELFKAARNSEANYVISDCGTCRLQIAHGTNMNTAHPVNILHQAYFPADAGSAAVRMARLTTA